MQRTILTTKNCLILNVSSSEFEKLCRLAVCIKSELRKIQLNFKKTASIFGDLDNNSASYRVSLSLSTSITTVLVECGSVGS